ncbi:MAG: hypothetical protein D6719_01440, partial [Candidatus Dadabacteria bacterium]
ELGLIPPQFNYEKQMIDFYLTQIAGYYDPEKKHFIMASWMPAIMQQPIAVHELTHALQDQYYDLENYLNQKKQTTDQSLARSALIEGDATAVMLDYTRQLAGQKSIARDADVSSFMLQNVMGVSMLAGSAGVPRSMQMLMLFPYTSGLRYVHALLKKGGFSEVDKAFRRAPRSCEEILHPEKFFLSKQDFQAVTKEELTSMVAKGYTRSYYDSLGEFVISLVLNGNGIDQSLASKAAAGWGGDGIALFENEETKQKLIIWKTLWDSSKDRQEFFGALKSGLLKRYPKYEVQSSTDSLSLSSTVRTIELKAVNNEVLLKILIKES